MGDRFALFTGVDDLALESAVLGIDGWVAGIGLAFPYENQFLWDLTQEGEWEEARKLYRWYTPLLHLDVSTKLVQNIKLAMQETGLGNEWVRAPRLPLVGAERSPRSRHHPRGNRHPSEAPGQEACSEAGPQTWEVDHAPSPESRPNVIVVVADDMGYGDLGLFNEGRSSTPNLNAIAADGVCLTQHYSGSPVCAPSRAALLTGRYPLRVGAVDTLGSGARSNRPL